ncbi:MAG: queuosine precursor transporter [Deltaproteobacteria bacterium]|jgi:queuosine precursor transporter|nr:queuosine precursor transporter [Deltaproteobacteria bacterium]MBT4091200.1 queuosine precursor transporter [Deltaproteobacteria bacterium]MBT4268924.1 queuosine precursor transporter [Deltaproteobacteria bacterium]MBT4638873.1 queuosine precursor transporter [Deltaproteobacteria bacterium]MBT6502437.1 queuosine precursor transporter [Deltaproteobacteria bacterium]
MNELYWVLLLLLNFAAILLAYRIFGKTGLYIWTPIAVIVANIQVLKTIELFGVVATLGNIVYATSFLATDILSENHGKKDAQKAVAIGFFSLIAMTAFMQVALLFTPHSSDFAHESLSTLFSIMPRIALASLVAYLISQLHDIKAYHFWKTKFPDTKHIWLRNNASTMVSQLLDSVIFSTIAFYGLFPMNVFLEILITTYLLKWLVAALDTPLLYLAKSMHSRGKIPV